jgi:hypothetical protein
MGVEAKRMKRHSRGEQWSCELKIMGIPMGDQERPARRNLYA